MDNAITLYEIPVNGGGSAPTIPIPIVIPTPKLKVTNLPSASKPIRPILETYWDAENLDFLNYNPEIWLFRFKPTYQRKTNTPSEYYNFGKRWVHPTHLDGSAHAGEPKYSGKPATIINVNFGQIISPQNYFYRPSEFPLPVIDKWTPIDIQPDLYFYCQNTNNGNAEILQYTFDTFGVPIFGGILNGTKSKNDGGISPPINRIYATTFCFVISIKVNNLYYFSDKSVNFKIWRDAGNTPIFQNLRMVVF